MSGEQGRKLSVDEIEAILKEQAVDPTEHRVSDLVEWARAIIAKYENTPADAPAAAPTEGG